MVVAVMHCSRGPGLSWLTDDGNHLPDLPILMEKNPKDDEMQRMYYQSLFVMVLTHFFTVLQGGKYHYFICDFKIIYNLHSYGV